MMHKTSLIFLGAIAGAGRTLLATQPHMVFVGSSAKAASSDTYRQLRLLTLARESVGETDPAALVSAGSLMFPRGVRV